MCDLCRSYARGHQYAPCDQHTDQYPDTIHHANSHGYPHADRHADQHRHANAIRVWAFDDQNTNGDRDAEEQLLSGARIDLLNAQRTPIAGCITDASAEPYTFWGLAKGDYFLREIDPQGYTSSSPNEVAISMVEGALAEVSFADYVAPTPTATVEPSPTNTSKPPTSVPPTLVPTPTEPSAGTLGQQLSSISGLLVALVALIVPLALRFLRARV
jgi:hypothetical protein